MALISMFVSFLSGCPRVPILPPTSFEDDQVSSKYYTTHSKLAEAENNQGSAYHRQI